MAIVFDNSEGWTEAVIDNNCGYDKFYIVSELMVKNFQIEFINKLNDFDTFYWDFTYHDSPLTLHYNIYLGVSIFPRELKLATSLDNEKVIEIGQLISDKLESRSK